MRSSLSKRMVIIPDDIYSVPPAKSNFRENDLHKSRTIVINFFILGRIPPRVFFYLGELLIFS